MSKNVHPVLTKIILNSTALVYRILGIQVKQPPGLVHEIRKVVENPEAHAENSRAAVFQSVVLRWN